MKHHMKKHHRHLRNFPPQAVSFTFQASASPVFSLRGRCAQLEETASTVTSHAMTSPRPNSKLMELDPLQGEANRQRAHQTKMTLLAFDGSVVMQDWPQVDLRVQTARRLAGSLHINGRT